jgi:hypothetical protein
MLHDRHVFNQKLIITVYFLRFVSGPDGLDKGTKEKSSMTCQDAEVPMPIFNVSLPLDSDQNKDRRQQGLQNMFHQTFRSKNNSVLLVILISPTTPTL